MAPTSSELVQRALSGDRNAVARLITLVESGDDALRAVMAEVYPHTGGAYVVGVTGAPGAGKSTLVQELIAQIRALREPVAVLAVDPTSPFSGGALLGDRVRMQVHATDGGVFIRSMANRGHLGGLALAAPEAVRILDAAGASYVLLETVGVGQSEVEVMDAADTVIVAVTPRWGDGIQAGKAGLLEIGDVFVVNKADRDGVRETVRDLNQMIDFGPHRSWRPPIIETVATSGTGIVPLWAAVQAHRAHLESTGELSERRQRRLRREIAAAAAERVRAHVGEGGAGVLDELVDRAARREIDPQAAAAELLSRLGLRQG
ncbi:MAG TPA: methylmalonyl Co-A mutase-associated GTPase MeaB [Actinomycetota bacterium]|nr:methylmalonyl Co-A mutase-associated GTPase MeaB [Actinomycetota bacterium]